MIDVYNKKLKAEMMGKPEPRQFLREAPLLDKTAYISCYATKLQELLSIDAELATQSAEASFEDWDGVYTPEEAADDEAGYWAADI